MYDYSKLKGRIVEKFGTFENFSKKMDKSPTTIGRKLSGKSGWTQSEIVKAAEILDFSPNDVPTYFFKPNV